MYSKSSIWNFRCGRSKWLEIDSNSNQSLTLSDSFLGTSTTHQSVAGYQSYSSNLFALQIIFCTVCQYFQDWSLCSRYVAVHVNALTGCMHCTFKEGAVHMVYSCILSALQWSVQDNVNSWGLISIAPFKHALKAFRFARLMALKVIAP